MGIKIAELFALIGADTKPLDQGLSKAEGKLKGFISGGLGQLAGSYLSVATAAVLASAAISKSFDLGSEGAAIERVNKAVSASFEKLGLSATEMKSSVRQASLGTISDLDIMQVAGKALEYGVVKNVDQLGQVAMIATAKSKTMGMTTTQAFGRIIEGVGKLSPEILRSTGIVFNAEQAYSTYAKGLGKTVQELTLAEKQQALLNATIQQGLPSVAAMGSSLKDNKTEFEIFGANLQNMGNNLKEHFAGPVASVLHIFNNFMTGSRENLDRILNTNQALAAVDYSSYVQSVMESAKANGYFIDSSGNLMMSVNSLTGTVEHLVQKNFLLTEAQFKTQQSNKETGLSAEELDRKIEAEKKQLDKLIESGTVTKETFDLLIDRHKTLKENMDEWVRTTADEVARQLGKVLPEASDLYVEGLRAIDEVFGTTKAQQYEFLKQTEDLAKQFAETGDIEAFTAGLRELKDSGLAPMISQLASVTDEAQTLYDKLSSFPEEVKIAIKFDVEELPDWVKDFAGGSSTFQFYNGGGGGGGGGRGYATGGTVWGGESILVGEHRPEVFRPFSAGWIDPQPKTNARGMTVNFNMRESTLNEHALRLALRRSERMLARVR